MTGTIHGGTAGSRSVQRGLVHKGVRYTKAVRYTKGCSGALRGVRYIEGCSGALRGVEGR